MTEEQNAGAVARQFELSGEFVEARSFGSGHINDTYRVTFAENGARHCSVLQRINHHIFTQPVALMENIQRVTAHLATQGAGEPDRARRALALISARDGRAWHVDADGYYWRAYRYIPHVRSYDAVETEAQAFEAGRAFGQFQEMLSSLPAPRLHDTIPDFHNTPKRFRALQQAIAADVAGRAAQAAPEIEFALAHEHMVGVLLAANLPERVTHNDTKFNNVMLDEVTGEAVCVVDLDTVMPGLAGYDFGDMVRTTTSPALEDERDLSKVTMQFHLFDALLRGYLSAAGRFLTTAEIELLAFSGKLITFEIGIRFLTDYLAGDTYFKVHRAGHNLDRCRTQFKLAESIEQQEGNMSRLVASLV